MEDGLKKFGWLQHDGKNFGIQEIHDENYIIETSFIKFYTGKFGGEWTARINVKPKNPNITEPMSLIWYAALDEKSEGYIKPTYSNIYGIEGDTKGLGSFKVNLHNTKGNIIKQSFVSTVAPSLQMLKETILSNLRVASDKMTKERFIILSGEQDENIKPNFVALQLNVQLPFTLDVTFQGTPNVSTYEEDVVTLPIGDDYTNLLDKKRKEFETKFSETFQIKEKGYSEEEVKIAQAALSNMLGGIGYFYGSSRVQSIHNKNGPVPYWKAPLLTGVPSRSFFPRGFLWDEGFHGLLISAWDIDLELDIISHWFDLINIEGWIPREQILGVEALARVPEQFVIQHNTNGNPPTFFLTLKHMLDNYPREMLKNSRVAILDRLYPRLHAWFQWFNNTQRGDLLGTYRWRGRQADSIHELNPKTLTSGLDDFPRSSHPTDNERHVDLRCWITLAAGVMSQIGNILGKNVEKYEETFYYLSDNQLLQEQHYSVKAKNYADFGLHTDSVSLKRPPSPPQNPNNPYDRPQQADMIRVVFGNPETRFVDTTFGYVNLFPFLLQIIEPENKILGTILTKLRDPELLWTNYGLRSLAKSSPLYMKRNTEHDPPYWRGQIWININYLVLKSLHHYMHQSGSPYAEQAKDVYKELRNNIVTNIIRQYKLTGYVWEQYNDQSGKGSGCYPFTGWSALFVMIMSEKY
jgi:mannosyl-oligosaccharide glucosidase